jgi:hypothetical protein
MTFNRRREDKSVFCDDVVEVLMVVFINLLLIRGRKVIEIKEVSILEKLILILILISSF